MFGAIFALAAGSIYLSVDFNNHWSYFRGDYCYRTYWGIYNYLYQYLSFIEKLRKKNYKSKE